MLSGLSFDRCLGRSIAADRTPVFFFLERMSNRQHLGDAGPWMHNGVILFTVKNCNESTLCSSLHCDTIAFL